MHQPHKTIRVEHGNQSADIDELIAPLIKAMWQAGITTQSCCQDNDEVHGKPPKQWPSICFWSLGEATKFLTLAYDPVPTLIAIRNDCGEDGLNMAHALEFSKWKMDIIPKWYAENIEYSVYVSFPQKEVGSITERLRQATKL